ncbi:MAG: hypothetical protein HOW73_17020 [Polyangiaceae bacterium]|nr:hypothetical protein [Polyangiaceae bacterium]
MKRLLGGVLWVGLAGAFAIGAGCGGAVAPQAPGAQGSTMTETSASCERRAPRTGAARYADARQSGAVALAQHGDRTLAYVADEDSMVVYTIDVDSKDELARTPVDGSPAQLLVLADGRVAVTLKDKNELQILEPPTEPAQQLASLCKQALPAEPIAMAATPDDKQVLVTSGWGGAVTALDSTTLKPDFALDLPREPRAILIDERGERAFVSHAVGAKLSVIDLTKSSHDVREIDMGVTTASQFTVRTVAERRRSGSQGYALAASVTNSPGPSTGGELPPISGGPTKPAPAKKPPAEMPQGRIFAPMVTVDPGDPNVRSQAYYGEARNGVPKEAPMVSVIDAGAERSLTRAVMSLGTPMTQECLLPRAAATRAENGTLLVTCLGADTLLELDTRGADPIRLERRRWAVPSGPTGLAVDERASRAVVWSQFEGVVTVVDLNTDKVDVVNVSYDPTPEKKQLALGRLLFHTTDDLRIANDGVACASCHPDGRDDAFTWSTPDGPRQTIMLAGRAPNTAPYGWQGKHGDLKTYLGNTFSRLGGTGVQGAELEALVKYLEKVPAPPRNESADKVKLVAEGKTLFMDTTLGCAGCHVNGQGVDKTTHDVGSRAVADVDDKFDTPSLLFVRGTGPYFHDGRYKTLDEMLSASDSEMGHTLHLDVHQRESLAAYLQSL